MQGKAKHGRRYSFRVHDRLIDPAAFNFVDAYNPSNLNAEARKVAQSLVDTFATGEELVLVKHLASEDRDEAVYVAGRRLQP